MEIIFFKNDILLNIYGVNFYTSEYQFNDKKTILTGLGKFENVDLLENFKHVDENMYYVKKDINDKELYFILKDYHDYIIKNHINLLMYDMDHINDIYIHVLRDYICNIHDLKINSIIDDNNQFILITEYDKKYKFKLFNYINLINNKNFDILFDFLKKINKVMNLNKDTNFFIKILNNE